MDLHFDFTRDARRSSIASQLRDALGEEDWNAARAEAQAAGVPMRHHHGIVEVRETVSALDVPDSVKDDLRDVYEILAAAEAQVHGCEVDETHFHEVGEGAGILNALEICCAFARLAPVRVTSTAVQTGSGQVECAHGLLDIPAPATAAILAMEIPTCDDKLEGELCTPTSAAIVKHFVDGFDR